MKRIALALIACLWASLAFGQANNVSTFQTPGNSTVPGYVPLGVTAAGVASISAAGNAGYPPAATPITASSVGTTNATTAALATNLTKFTYICGFQIGSTATAAAAGNATVVGAVTGTMNFEMGTGTSPAVVITQQTFTPCIPSSAINTSIAVISAAPGAGGVISVSSWGYQQ